MERNEISLHEVKVYAALTQNSDCWLSNAEIASLTEGVSARTVRLHTKRLVDLGLLDLAEVFPSHRYRHSTNARNRNAAYLGRLLRAAEVFGVTLAG